jgi:uncharacterized membrane protein YhiD involved in acid resistance
MVGALSIVRFRTAIKEPLDIAFLFWAIAGGIVIAAGLIPLAIFGSVLIGLILLLFVNKKSFDNTYILVASVDNEENEKALNTRLKDLVKKTVVKSKTVQAGRIELHFEIRLKNEETEFVNELSSMTGVKNITLVSYNGDYQG